MRITFLAPVLSGVSYNLDAMGRMPELTATADQALIRASKAHTGIRREIPVSVAREYGKRRSLTTLGDFSDLLRHPGHRIVCVQDSFPFSSGASSLPLQGGTAGEAPNSQATPS